MVAHLNTNLLTGKMQVSGWPVVVQRLSFEFIHVAAGPLKPVPFEMTFSVFAIIRSDHVEYPYPSVGQSFTLALI